MAASESENALYNLEPPRPPTAQAVGTAFSTFPSDDQPRPSDGDGVLRACAASVRPPSDKVLEGLLPVVGSTPSIPSFLMSSHSLSMCTGFLLGEASPVPV